MVENRFDSLARALGSGQSRRRVLRTLLGIGGVTAAGAVLHDTDAARRGASGPTLPTPQPTVPPQPTLPPLPTQTLIPTPVCAGVLCNGTCCDGRCTSAGACCPAGSTVCGPECCPNGQAECCDNACCYGTCYGEELCCPGDQPVCSVDGCCNGVCIQGGQFCCPANRACGDDCCDAGSERCCADGDGSPMCIASNACCSDRDCAGGRCQNGACVPYTPTTAPSATAVPSSTPTPQPTETSTPTLTATASATVAPRIVLSFRRDPDPDIIGFCIVTTSVSGFTPNSAVTPTHDWLHQGTLFEDILLFGFETDASGNGSDPFSLSLPNCPGDQVRVSVDGTDSIWYNVSCPGAQTCND